jgi:hypothetical protein
MSKRAASAYGSTYMFTGGSLLHSRCMARYHINMIDQCSTIHATSTTSGHIVSSENTCNQVK